VEEGLERGEKGFHNRLNNGFATEPLLKEKSRRMAGGGKKRVL
jgi:hypothetical protein